MLVNYRGKATYNIEYNAGDLITVGGTVDYYCCAYVVNPIQFTPKQPMTMYVEVTNSTDCYIITANQYVNQNSVGADGNCVFDFFSVKETIKNNIIIRDFSFRSTQSDLGPGIYNVNFGGNYNLVNLVKANRLESKFTQATVYKTGGNNNFVNGTVKILASDAEGVLGFIFDFSSSMEKLYTHTVHTVTTLLPAEGE